MSNSNSPNILSIDIPLKKQACEACVEGAPRITPEEAEVLIEKLDSWEIVDRHGVWQLLKNYSFSNFVDAQDFANQIGHMAEDLGHHPAILTEWGRVTVRWWTHKIKGLHRNDFICAAKTDDLYIQS